MYGVSGMGEAEEIPDPPKKKLLGSKRLDKIVDSIDDSGLLFNTIPVPEKTRSDCWRCSRKPAETELGLCEPCDRWLHDNDNFVDDDHPVANPYLNINPF